MARYVHEFGSNVKDQGPALAGPLDCLGVPGMGTILWGGSPLWNPWKSYVLYTTATSRGQGLSAGFRERDSVLAGGWVLVAVVLGCVRPGYLAQARDGLSAELLPAVYRCRIGNWEPV